MSVEYLCLRFGNATANLCERFGRAMIVTVVDIVSFIAGMLAAAATWAWTCHTTVIVGHKKIFNALSRLGVFIRALSFHRNCSGRGEHEEPEG